jgi:hypothetical protein
MARSSGHPVKLLLENGHVDGVERQLAGLVVHIGIVHINIAVIEARHHDPVRKLFAVDAIGADQHNRNPTGFELFLNGVHTQRAVAHLHRQLPELGDEILLHQTHDLFLFLAAHRVQKHDRLAVYMHLDVEAQSVRRQRHAVGTAAAVARSHVHGGGFPPQTQLQLAGKLQLRLQRLHGHHQRRGSAGKIQRLFIVGYPHQLGFELRRQVFFVAQRLHVILVIIGVLAEQPVAEFLVQIDGLGIVTPHFQAQADTVVGQRRLFGSLDKRPADPPSAGGGKYRQRIHACQ